MAKGGRAGGREARTAERKMFISKLIKKVVIQKWKTVSIELMKMVGHN